MMISAARWCGRNGSGDAGSHRRRREDKEGFFGRCWRAEGEELLRSGGGGGVRGGGGRRRPRLRCVLPPAQAPPSPSARWGMCCARRAATSSRPPESAMFAGAPPVGTAGATPWSAWWSPSASPARTPPMVALPGQPTMTSRPTVRFVCIHRATAPTKPVPLARWRHSWTTSPNSTAGHAPQMSRTVRSAACASITASISPVLTVPPTIKTPLAAATACFC
uniref:Uncharacterized protein n=1 Tax=Arundo donax TaxID=35708 RepID=A0A0A8Z776_ARUDO